MFLAQALFVTFSEKDTLPETQLSTHELDEPRRLGFSQRKPRPRHRWNPKDAGGADASTSSSLLDTPLTKTEAHAYENAKI